MILKLGICGFAFRGVEAWRICRKQVVNTDCRTRWQVDVYFGRRRPVRRWGSQDS
jgi:hypothetical protein